MSEQFDCSPEAVLEDLKWLIIKIFRGLEHGTYKARIYFEAESSVRDPFIASGLTRYHTKQYLASEDLDAVDVENVNLCGLSLALERYEIKILKSDELPVPGSTLRTKFYQQSLFDVLNGNPMHLLILWDIDVTGNLCSKLLIVWPRDADKKTAEFNWQLPVDINELISSEAECDSESVDEIDFPNHEEKDNKKKDGGTKN